MMKGCKIARFLAALLVGGILVALPGALQGQVNTDELEKGQAPVEFFNYEGPVTRIDSRAQIRGIGYTLGTAVRSGALRSGSESRYFVIHGASSPEGARLDADIFGLGAAVGVDHIRNLRLIIQGYLEGAYNYAAQDANLLAQYITIYNAVYRGNWRYFSAAYKQSVLQYLTQDKAGLSLRFNEWPGQTLMLIPLGIGSAGSLSAIDTTSISDSTVLDELRKEGDLSMDQRKDMVEFKEREAEEAEQEALRRQQAIAEEEARIAAERTALEAEQARLAQEQAQAEAARAQGQLSPEEAEQAAQELAAQEAAAREREHALQEQEAALAEQREQAERLEAFAEQKRDEAQQDREGIAGDQQGLMDEAEEPQGQESAEAVPEDSSRAEQGSQQAEAESSVASSTDSGQDETGNIPQDETENIPEDARDEAAQEAESSREDQAEEEGGPEDGTGQEGREDSPGDERSTEAEAGDTRDTADTGAEDQEQSWVAVENAQVPGVIGMALTSSATSQGSVVKVNPASGAELKRTSLNTINIRTVVLVDKQIIAVAGDGNMLRLVTIDPDTLEVLQQGEDAIHPESLLWVNGSDLYGIIVSEGNCYLARFDTALTRQAQSEMRVHPYGTLLFDENMLSTQDANGKAVILDPIDLIEGR
ncbi:MAG: hypothetical protein LBP88_06845 [Treponema sp.]|nr:hypothetical protein [Treponema sp.]